MKPKMHLSQNILAQVTQSKRRQPSKRVLKTEVVRDQKVRKMKTKEKLIQNAYDTPRTNLRAPQCHCRLACMQARPTT